MHRRAVATVVSVFSLALFSGTSSADQSDSIKSKARVVYEDTSNIPDDVYLSSFLDFLVIRFGRNPEKLAAYVNQKLELDNQSKAKRYSELFLATGVSINRQVDIRKKDLLCQSGVARPSEQVVYTALDSIDEDKIDINRTELESLKQYLGDEDYAKFLTWMAKTKSSTTLIFLDHAKTYVGRDPESVREELCQRLQDPRVGS